MKPVLLIFPNQIFEDLDPIINQIKPQIYLIEDPLFYGDVSYKFKPHKQKILFHRLSLLQYSLYLNKQGFETQMIYYSQIPKSPRYFFSLFEKHKDVTFYFYECIDFILNKRLMRFFNELNIKHVELKNKAFLKDSLNPDLVFKNNRKYLMANFYSSQRKHLNLLMEGDKPIGGKWSFDEDNRKKLPQGISIPPVYSNSLPENYEKVKAEVLNEFPNNPGNIKHFIYPVSFSDSKEALNNFLQYKFKEFGIYEDAISKSEVFLFHSILSPLINSGLLSPDYVINQTIDFALQNQIPLNSLEGFIRQIIGWREYMAYIYKKEGVFLRTNNYFGFNNKLSSKFYDGNTGIKPFDVMVKKLKDFSYTHHIERLMIAGNLMLLCEIDPDEVYYWFMDYFIDSYDWVMVPNVYGMSQFADGGLICTKPYISGSAYVLKMSDFEKGEWTSIWDALYWRFIHNHVEVFSKNPRMSMMAAMIKKMDTNKLNNHLKISEKFLSELL